MIYLSQLEVVFGFSNFQILTQLQGFNVKFKIMVIREALWFCTGCRVCHLAARR